MKEIDFENISDEEFELVLKGRFKAYEQEYDAVKEVLDKINKEKGVEVVDGEYETKSN